MEWTSERLRDLAERGASLEAQRDALGAGLKERGIGEAQIDAVLTHTDAAVILRKQEEPSPNWIGGSGMFPAGTTEWPRDSAGAPFTPVAHFDLDELPKLPSPFPQTGVLEIYYDFGWVEADPEMAAFIEAGRAYRLDDDAVQLPEPEDDIFREDPTYLSGVLMPVAGEPDRVIEKIGGFDHARPLIDAMNDLTKGVYGHQIGGLAREFQSDVLSEVPYDLQRATTEFRSRYSEEELTSPDAWQLLATVEAEGTMMFGDGGNLYVVIPKSDLRRGDFDRAIGIAQGA